MEPQASPGERPTSPSSSPRLWLAAILLLAGAVRLWGIGYGLPWLFYFHDEPQVVLRALRFGTGDLNPHFFIWPGTLLLELAFLSYMGYFAVGLAAGWWSGASGFAAAYFRDPSPFYLIARSHSVLFGVASVGIGFGLGRDAYSTAVGLATALGIAVSALHAHYSHLAHPVIGMTAAVWFGLWRTWRAADRGSRRDLDLAGVAMGVGTAVQYHAALLALPIVVAVGLRMREEGRGAWKGWGLAGARSGAIAIAVFLILCPFALLDAAGFLGDLAWITAKTTGEPPSPLQGAWLFVTQCIVPSLSLPVAIAGAIGMVRAIGRRSKADLLLLAFTIGYVLLGSRAGTLNDRYGIPLVMPALLWSGSLVEEALARWHAPRRTAITVAVVGVLSSLSLIELIESDYTMSRPDTREVALRWFEREVPANSRVLLDMAAFWNSKTAPLAGNREYCEERIRDVQSGVSGAGHSAVYVEYFRHQLEHPRHPAYYLRGTRMGADVRPLDEFRAQGFEWAMVSDEAVRTQEARAARGDSTGLRYYLELERTARLAAEFLPGRWTRRGPQIRVYDLAARGPR